MAVRETIQTPEQKALEAATQSEKESEFAAQLAQSMDLPNSLAKQVDAEAKRPAVQPEEEDVQEEVQEESQEEVSEEQITEEQAEEEVTEEDEDLIPKSKVQKRINELTREKAQLESRLRRLEEQSERPRQTEDPELKKLENMSEAELQSLKRHVRLQQIKNASNEQALTGYLDLEEKIDRTLQTAPRRFQENQNQKLLQAVQDSASYVENFDKVKAEIFKTADKIYSGSPELMGAVGGKARAWQIAVDHFTALNSLSMGKSKQVELERQVNTLKKKISVDTSSKKTVSKPDDTEAKLFKKAKQGSVQDKEAYVRKLMNTDAIISEEELARFRR